MKQQFASPRGATGFEKLQSAYGILTFFKFGSDNTIT
jgi:hypothetical protein